MRQGWAHPRSRGADRLGLIHGHAFRGSSPRAGRTDVPPSSIITGRAHPRSRGADRDEVIRLAHQQGSSPLARGGQARRVEDGYRQGLIPARAGRTGSTSGISRCVGAHPRSRGADTLTALGLTAKQGSSPLARGGLEQGSDAWLQARAHPRSRGADNSNERDSSVSRGSSPLARGGRRLGCAGAGRRGLIPARAGRTVPVRTMTRRVRAHPRSRGADAVSVALALVGEGSSPLARGGPGAVRLRARAIGLIPARAGRTRSHATRAPAAGAHPRSRGADPGPLVARPARTGSSPLARGGHLLEPLALKLRGLIPARAGRT